MKEEKEEEVNERRDRRKSWRERKKRKKKKLAFGFWGVGRCWIGVGISGWRGAGGRHESRFGVWSVGERVEGGGTRDEGEG